MSKVSAIICAAGKGQRAGFSKNKLLVPVDGIPVLQRTLQAFLLDEIKEIIVAHSPEDKEEILSLTCHFDNVKLVEGGDTRSETVYNALQAATGDIVLIHDGARPFVTSEILRGCIRSVEEFGSGICAVACTDTIAIQNADGRMESTLPRPSLAQIQTPQGFFRQEITSAYRRAFENGKLAYTDDSAIYHDFVGAPKLCAGSQANIKLTYPSDFISHSAARCGFGIDTHAFGKEQNYIVLAGVQIPAESGLIAHSDGDVLVHAVMDALLSAAGLKDIGHYFPDTDEKWKGASSMSMLAQVFGIIRDLGFRVQNLSIAIQAERPRLAKYISAMQENLANALRIDLDCVGISAGTNEGLGYVGEGKGITVNAYALLNK